MASALKDESLAKNLKNCNPEEKLLMLTNGGHISFNNMGYLLLLPMKVHINETYMANILYFVEVANISGLHINMDTSKEKVTNVHIEDKKIIHFKSCA